MNSWVHPIHHWQPFETVPEQQTIDIWIKSYNNANYGRRATNVTYVASANKWYGCNLPQEQFGEYVSHWMPIPSAPIE